MKSKAVDDDTSKLEKMAKEVGTMIFLFLFSKWLLFHTIVDENAKVEANEGVGESSSSTTIDNTTSKTTTKTTKHDEIDDNTNDNNTDDDTDDEKVVVGDEKTLTAKESVKQTDAQLLAKCTLVIYFLFFLFPLFLFKIILFMYINRWSWRLMSRMLQFDWSLTIKLDRLLSMLHC